jgi:hypothetical protein
MADVPDKTHERSTPDYVNALLTEGSSPQNLMDYLNRQMVPVPDFTPPSPRGDNVCQIPTECSQEDAYEFRSAGVLLQALAAEARAWSEKLPPEFRPAIVAILHGGLQIEVRTLAQVSFDGIRIEGLMGDSPCSLLAHQGTVQLVCHAVRVEEEQEDRPIGFIWPDRDEHV